MRSLLAATAFAGWLASAHASGTVTGPPMGVYKTAYNEPAVTATTLIGVPLATAVSDLTKNLRKRNAEPAAKVLEQPNLVRRDDTCVAQPSGISYKTSPDDPNTFQKDSYYSNAANSAATPYGYTAAFKNIVASNNADNYQGFTFLDSYDVSKCAAQCDQQEGCASFNIYFERDPVLSPDPTNCPNPASLTRIKCVWWGGLVSLNNANNYGQQIASFYVVIAGANGYTNDAKAAKIQAAATATQQAPTATETAKSGSVWLVYYSADSSQGSYSNAQASSSEADCQVACDADSQCNAYTYVGGASGVGSGTCWLKAQLGNPTVANNNVVSGVRAVGGSAGSANTQTTTAATSSSAAASTAAAPSVPPATTASAVVIDQPVYGTQTNNVQYITTISYDPSATKAPGSSSSSSSSSFSSASSSSTSTIPTTTTTAALTAAYTTSGLTTAASTTAARTTTAQSTAAQTTAAQTTAASTTKSNTTSSTTTAAPSTTPASSTTFSIVTSTATTSSVSKLPTAFKVRTGWDLTSNLFAYVSTSSSDSLRNVISQSSGSTFTVDSQGYVHTADGNTDYVAYLPKTGGAWQKLSFKSVATASKGDTIACKYQSPYVVCSTPSIGMVFAGTCNNDGYIYFGSPSKVPSGCAWTGLWPVPVTASTTGSSVTSSWSSLINWFINLFF